MCVCVCIIFLLKCPKAYFCYYIHLHNQGEKKISFNPNFSGFDICWEMPILRYLYIILKWSACRFKFLVLVTGTKSDGNAFVSLLHHPKFEIHCEADCKFPHLTVANFLYSLYIYKPNWHIRLPSLDPRADPQRNYTPLSKIPIVTFKAPGDKTFSVIYFF